MDIGKIIFWITTVLVSIVFFFSAQMAIRSTPEYLEMYSQYNYPLYLPRIHGFLKLLAAIALLIPRRTFLKHWAYAGMGFTLVLACLAHYYAGEPFYRQIGVFFLLLISYFLYMDKMNFKYL